MFFSGCNGLLGSRLLLLFLCNYEAMHPFSCSDLNFRTLNLRVLMNLLDLKTIVLANCFMYFPCASHPFRENNEITDPKSHRFSLSGVTVTSPSGIKQVSLLMYC